MTIELPAPGPDERDVAPGTPSQVANPWRTTVRSVVQSLVALIPLVNLSAAAVIDYLREEGIGAPAWVWLVLNGAVAVTALVAGLVTRLMAVPGVEAFLRARVPWLAALAPRR